MFCVLEHHNLSQKGTHLGTKLIFSCLRNEGPFLLEWVSYHLSFGFDHFVLFTNDCEDGTDAIADRLADMGLATHIRNAPGKRGPQWTALNSDALAEALTQADCAIHLDADEFINAPGLDHLTEAMGSADALSLPWRFFGSAGQIRFADLPVVQQFTRCGPYPVDFPRQALMFKTLFRPGARLNRAGVHGPRPNRGEGMGQLAWLTGNGTPVSARFAPNAPVLYGPDAGNRLGQINHYALKSRESFLVKSARGLPNHGHVPVDLSYWARRNFNSLEDRSLADRVVDVDLRGSDPALADLHDRAVAWHRQKIHEVLGTPAGVELFSALAVVGDTVVPDAAEVRMLYAALGRVFGKDTGADG